ncbi:uncharacterized protein BT62DRAFT_100152 [Guyanagaster necrorhizus]|uniref:Uncharacterized protein n=1 Tax=Guyanagaster necrorhizus TaxID=856835 RepID=A0A9P7VU89_9AGAR|nr:uncharacterized protein BT62DRAFT_100152 [Guyanagaster necrorhizus MCA 3950]KAG7447054.1 hypothetical protein BT62DRAFT_100152 [Guyanagaster necrorhizus MCA 3950]
MATNTVSSGCIPFPSVPQSGKFAFARLCSDREVYLVQLTEESCRSLCGDLSCPQNAPNACFTNDTQNASITLRLFRHEFISIFRLAGSKTVRLSDIRILEVIDDAAKRYEEEQGVVFLARGLVSGMRR